MTSSSPTTLWSRLRLLQQIVKEGDLLNCMNEPRLAVDLCFLALFPPSFIERCEPAKR
jgi:hypothetical protein